MKSEKENKPLIINEINLRSIDRSRKDITAWRNALSAAESVYAPNRTRLYDLYEDILLDGHLTGVVAKKINSVLNKELAFVDNGKRVTDFDKLIGTHKFRQLIELIVESLLWGISAIEFIPGAEFDFCALPRKHIMPARQLISYEQGGATGISYAGDPNIWVVGNAQSLGLLLRCAPYCLYKRGGIADWAQFIELFGQPVRVIKYDSYDEQTKAELKKILDEAGSSLAMMIPRQADFEITDGKQANSDGGLQHSFIKAMNEEISVTVLGNTETTNSSRSAGYAQSKIHQEQQNEIAKADMAYTLAMLNSPQLLNMLASYGYPVGNGRFEFCAQSDVAYLAQRIAIDKELAQLTTIHPQYWQRTYGIPQP